MELQCRRVETAKVRIDVHLRIFPDTDPETFLEGRWETETGESTTWTELYRFPDDVVVVCLEQVGPAAGGARDSRIRNVEIHHGPEVRPETLERARQYARKAAPDAEVEW